MSVLPNAAAEVLAASTEKLRVLLKASTLTLTLGSLVLNSALAKTLELISAGLLILVSWEVSILITFLGSWTKEERLVIFPASKVTLETLTTLKLVPVITKVLTYNWEYLETTQYSTYTLTSR